MFDDDDVVTVSFLCDQGIEATAVGTFVAIRYRVVCDHLKGVYVSNKIRSIFYCFNALFAIHHSRLVKIHAFRWIYQFFQ